MVWHIVFCLMNTYNFVYQDRWYVWVNSSQNRIMYNSIKRDKLYQIGNKWYINQYCSKNILHNNVS